MSGHPSPRASAALAGAACLCVLLAIAPPVAAQSAAPSDGNGSASLLGTQPLREIAIYPQREAAATVVARNEAKIAAEVGGVIVRWTAEAGSDVRKGELLVEIDAVDYRLAEQRAQAALDASAARVQQAERQLARARSLVAQNFISEEALIQRETEVALWRSELAANRAQLAIAARQLARTSVRAPFAASVKQRLAQTGEAVAAGSVLYLLSENGAAEISAHLPPADVPGLRRARQLALAIGEQRYPLHLLRVAATVATPARTQEVRLRFAAGNPPVPPGSDGRLLWREAQPHLPASVLVRRGDAIGVFVQHAASARFLPLPGAQEGRATPVTLPAETRIVVRGQATLQDGAPIR